jgi:ubiquinone/menaquinone biosynthesis C-methylase UbiE
MIDKDIEINRYDKRADSLLNTNKLPILNKLPAYLNIPYQYYFYLLGKKPSQSKLLEIGAGMGENTSSLLNMSFKVTSTDISSRSVEVMRNKFSKYSNFSAEVADMEKLPFADESFDVVCSAGSLSYGDNQIVMNEINRALKPGGKLIIVDSLHENPLYIINRWIGYFRGTRSLSTIKHMPTLKLIREYGNKFNLKKLDFFGL